ncbi:prostaglandin reductase 1-like [Saccoglossus kowalevskii]|uniref:Prostaglandin reductase 1 n=1 Tax=Saccoglossus kowalevskii TaxID=10224 RepID=A0ABM0MGN5_SACKO|nr:PREDICTED: prostaglandin reductase 1-like [Saccoglossus kowalevskii]
MSNIKRFVLAKQVEGIPQLTDFKILETKLPELKDGEILVKALYLSVDPYMRLFMSGVKEGVDTILGEQVARVVESKNPNYNVGDLLVCNTGWTTYSVPDKRHTGFVTELDGTFRKIDFPPDIPISYAIGLLGMPGLSAYFGLLDCCQPKEGETVYVNAAAGAVGITVGQIAKIKGCKVVGSAGSDEKVAFLKEVGFDEAFNYKTEQLDEALTRTAPNGIDCFFDNVGGLSSAVTYGHLNERARVVVFGVISQYNKSEQDKVPGAEITILMKRLSIKGFLFFDMVDKPDVLHKALIEMIGWIKEGRLKYKEAVIEGFENMPKAFKGIFSGDKFGKVVVKV